MNAQQSQLLSHLMETVMMPLVTIQLRMPLLLLLLYDSAHGKENITDEGTVQQWKTVSSICSMFFILQLCPYFF